MQRTKIRKNKVGALLLTLNKKNSKSAKSNSMSKIRPHWRNGQNPRNTPTTKSDSGRNKVVKDL